MIAEPRWFYDAQTNTMVINLINITSTDIMAKEGIGTVQMALVGVPEYNESTKKTSTLSCILNTLRIRCRIIRLPGTTISSIPWV